MSSSASVMQLPPDVLDWLRKVFLTCNERVSLKLSDAPHTHEESLDMTFVESFSHHESPVTLPSGWTMRFETHFIGGRRHWAKWEIADIGLLVMLRAGGKQRITKVALLQSKRLYPNEIEFDEKDYEEYMMGFRRLFEQDVEWEEMIKPRAFTFDDSSKYKALLVEDEQYKAIKGYEDEHKMPVYYLLYNPAQIPLTVHVPRMTVGQKTLICDVGCRVAPAKNVRNTLSNSASGSSPTYKELHAIVPTTTLTYSENWRLEDFAVDLLLSCQTGLIARSPDDYGLRQIFYRRSGPIGTAIAITVDGPEDFNYQT